MQVSGKGTGYDIFVKNDYLFKKQQALTKGAEDNDDTLYKYEQQLLNSIDEIKNKDDGNISIHFLPGSASDNGVFKQEDFIGMYSYDYEYNADQEMGGGTLYTKKFDSVDTFNISQVQKVKDKIEELYKNNPKVLNSSGVQHNMNVLNQILQDNDGKFAIHFDSTKDTQNKEKDNKNYTLLEELLQRDRIQNNQEEVAITKDTKKDAKNKINTDANDINDYMKLW